MKAKDLDISTIEIEGGQQEKTAARKSRFTRKFLSILECSRPKDEEGELGPPKNPVEEAYYQLISRYAANKGLVVLDEEGNISPSSQVAAKRLATYFTLAYILADIGDDCPLPMPTVVQQLAEDIS